MITQSGSEGSLATLAEMDEIARWVCDLSLVGDGNINDALN